ncbi:MAG: hypothetical protein ACE5KU_04725 [Nitrososphaerales archaeon]
MLVRGKSKGSSMSKYLHNVEKWLDLQEYSVESPAKVTGRSGVSHDVALYGEDSRGRRFIMEFVSSDDLVREEEVVRLFAIRLDTNVEVLMVVHPGLTKRAAELAKLYGITVLDTSGLGSLSSILG